MQLACQSETLLLVLSKHNRWWLARRARDYVSGLKERDRSLDYLFLWDRWIAGILKSDTISLKGRTTLWEKAPDLSFSEEKTWKHFYLSVNSNFQILRYQKTGRRQLVKTRHFTWRESNHHFPVFSDVNLTQFFHNWLNYTDEIFWQGIHLLGISWCGKTAEGQNTDFG